MSTTKFKTTSSKGPFDKIIKKLKKFMDNLFKQGQKTPVKPTPVKAAKPKVKPAPKKTAVKNKTAAAHKTKPKTSTGV
jgi:hypothetical protein